jgi:2-keto-4-pentenoate hydratase
LSAASLDPRIHAGLEAQVRALRARTEAGQRRIGWKVGLNDPRVQQALEISQPVIGYLASGTEVTSGSTHSLAGATRPAVEPEVAVHVGAGATVAGLGPALEVIDLNMPFDDLERLMAANVFHRAVVLGPMTGGLTTVDGMRASFRRDGEEQHAIDVAAAAMVPSDAIGLVSGYLEAVGEAPQAGDVIIAGSLVTAIPASPGERFELDVDGLGTVELAFTGR